MKISVDNWTERKTKKGANYHNFNIALDFGEIILYTMGWQLANGMVNPPSFRSGWRFYPMILTGGDFSDQLWEVLESDPRRPAGIREAEEAMAGIIATPMEFARLFPTF